MSALEDTLALFIQGSDVPAPEREFRFHPTRKWRFDFAWPALMWAVEVQGGTWVNGGHSRGKGMARDMEKRNEATLLGWRVLYFDTDMVNDGEAIQVIERALGVEG